MAASLAACAQPLIQAMISKDPNLCVQARAGLLLPQRARLGRAAADHFTTMHRAQSACRELHAKLAQVSRYTSASCLTLVIGKPSRTTLLVVRLQCSQAIA